MSKPKPRPTVVITKLTPDAARILLKENVANRPINRNRLAKLARTIKEGRWTLNGESIKVDTKGRLLDGQHRCHGVVQADKPIETVLVTGLDPSVFATIDQGKARSGTDIFQICGVRNAGTVSAALGLVWQHRKGFVLGITSSGYLPDMDERVALFDEIPDIEDRVAEVVSQRHHLRGISLSTVAGLYFLFYSVNSHAARIFMSVLCGHTTVPSGHPIGALRTRLNEIAENDYNVSKQARCALAKIAWNAFIYGEVVAEIEIPRTLDIPLATKVGSTQWLK